MRPSTVRLLAAAKAATAAAPFSASAAAAAAREAATAATGAGAAHQACAGAVPWYRKQYRGAQAETMFQAGWAVSLALLFIGIPLVGTTVQTTMREQAKQRMLEENSREREAFLRELYGLDAQGRLVKGQGKGEKEGGKGAGVARGKGE